MQSGDYVFHVLDHTTSLVITLEEGRFLTNSVANGNVCLSILLDTGECSAVLNDIDQSSRNRHVGAFFRVLVDRYLVLVRSGDGVCKLISIIIIIIIILHNPR